MERVSSALSRPARSQEEAILFPSCFDANAGIFEALLGKDDALLSDSLNHASIIDGTRLCKAQRHLYKHCDMADLEEKLKVGARVRGCALASARSVSQAGAAAALRRRLRERACA